MQPSRSSRTLRQFHLIDKIQFVQLVCSVCWFASRWNRIENWFSCDRVESTKSSFSLFSSHFHSASRCFFFNLMWRCRKWLICAIVDLGLNEPSNKRHDGTRSQSELLLKFVFVCQRNRCDTISSTKATFTRYNQTMHKHSDNWKIVNNLAVTTLTFGSSSAFALSLYPCPSRFVCFSSTKSNIDYLSMILCCTTANSNCTHVQHGDFNLRSFVVSHSCQWINNSIFDFVNVITYSQKSVERRVDRNCGGS